MSDTNHNAQVCQTILDQLGGTGRICSFLGTPRKHGIIYDGLKTTIQIKGCRKANRISITLDEGTDTYTVRTHKVGGGRLNKKTWEHSPLTDKLHTEHVGVYADMLVGIVESETGLYLSF